MTETAAETRGAQAPYTRHKTRSCFFVQSVYWASGSLSGEQLYTHAKQILVVQRARIPIWSPKIPELQNLKYLWTSAQVLFLRLARKEVESFIFLITTDQKWRRARHRFLLMGVNDTVLHERCCVFWGLQSEHNHQLEELFCIVAENIPENELLVPTFYEMKCCYLYNHVNISWCLTNRASRDPTVSTLMNLAVN